MRKARFAHTNRKETRKRKISKKISIKEPEVMMTDEVFIKRRQKKTIVSHFYSVRRRIGKMMKLTAICTWYRKFHKKTAGKHGNVGKWYVQ